VRVRAGLVGSGRGVTQAGRRARPRRPAHQAARSRCRGAGRPSARGGQNRRAPRRSKWPPRRTCSECVHRVSRAARRQRTQSPRVGGGRARRRAARGATHCSGVRHADSTSKHLKYGLACSKAPAYPRRAARSRAEAVQRAMMVATYAGLCRCMLNNWTYFVRRESFGAREGDLEVLARNRSPVPRAIGGGSACG
jgi:hypothetical protein